MDQAPRALFAACREAGVRRVIQVSALGADAGAASRFHLSKPARRRVHEKVRKSNAGRTMRSKIGPMKRVARMLRGHRLLILNWFRPKGQLSTGVVDGFNAKAKLNTRKAYGFQTYHGLEVGLYHALGALPEPSSDFLEEASTCLPSS